MQIARTKMTTAFGPGKFPSSAEISNAKWLGKQKFIFIGLFLIKIIDFYFFFIESRGILDTGLIENLAEKVRTCGLWSHMWRRCGWMKR